MSSTRLQPRTMPLLTWHKGVWQYLQVEADRSIHVASLLLELPGLLFLARLDQHLEIIRRDRLGIRVALAPSNTDRLLPFVQLLVHEDRLVDLPLFQQRTLRLAVPASECVCACVRVCACVCVRVCVRTCVLLIERCKLGTNKVVLIRLTARRLDLCPDLVYLVQVPCLAHVAKRGIAPARACVSACMRVCACVHTARRSRGTCPAARDSRGSSTSPPSQVSSPVPACVRVCVRAGVRAAVHACVDRTSRMATACL